jgi:predicted RNA binding protein YcfA (HicA-like mRNA interferase family)
VSQWPATKGRIVLRALNKIGWVQDPNQKSGGSHKKLIRDNQSYIFPFGDSEEIGPRMLPKIAKKTGLKPDDL